jgi:hypothetical protein
MPVTRHPLHRSVRAELPHTALALGHDDRTSSRRPFVSAVDAVRAFPARSPVRGASRRIRLGLPPSLHHLRDPVIADPALFGGFLGTTQQSDFSAPSLIGVRPQASRCALHPRMQKTLRSPGSRARCVHACSGSATARGPHLPRHDGKHGVAFGASPRPRHPGLPAPFGTGLQFRSSIPGLPFPLSTLRPRPRERARMTRGRRGWLSLQRMTLSFTTSRRFCPAHGDMERSPCLPSAWHYAQDRGLAPHAGCRDG